MTAYDSDSHQPPQPQIVVPYSPALVQRDEPVDTPAPSPMKIWDINGPSKDLQQRIERVAEIVVHGHAGDGDSDFEWGLVQGNMPVLAPFVDAPALAAPAVQ